MVWSSASAHGHVGLSVIPNLWKYVLNFPCPITIDVNSGDTGILFWDIRRRTLVVSYRRFGTNYLSHLQVSSSLKAASLLKMEPIGFSDGAWDGVVVKALRY